MISTEHALEIFQSAIKEKPKSITSLTGGMVGYVFRIETEQKSYVLKLYQKTDEVETIDDRVYGSNYKNLFPTHELLVANGVPTPRIYASGEINEYVYAVFDYLQGNEANDEIINHPVYATTLAKVHSIHRAYQGWIINKEPYATTWRDVFVESIQSRLRDVQDIIGTNLYTRVEAYIARNIPNFKDPEYFVLSHTDGLQALFNNNGGDWSLSGVIDIEDYQFTDQRFVLAGVTLMQKFHKYTLTDIFWNTYKEHTQFDQTFIQFESLFHVYYLLVWTKVHPMGSPAQQECMSVLENTVVN